MAPPAQQPLDHAVGKDQKIQRELVDIEPFVVEQPRCVRRARAGARARARARGRAASAARCV
jgi:hypothetical protein